MQDHPPLSLLHFRKLMGPYGLYQHANKREPNLAEGYCVDDNARAVIVLLAHLNQFPQSEEHPEELLNLCFQFTQDAQHSSGQYYNFRDANGTWLSHDISEDMYARLCRMYTYILVHDTNTDRATKAANSLLALVPTLQELTAPRAQAETVIALRMLPKEFLDANPIFNTIQTQQQENLLESWNTHSSQDWPWFESSLTYANGILPHSMLSEDTPQWVHESASFLLATTIQNGIFTPVGNKGWYSKGGEKAVYDQQAIEASSMFDFLLAYKDMFPDRVSDEQVAAPYRWFRGHNTKNIPMADVSMGACLDGLNETTPNENYGAESMLCYLWAELLLREAPHSIQELALKP